MVLRIKELREEMGLTQSELAAKIQNVQRNISNWENGNSEPDCQSILSLANIFQIPIDRLFGRVFTGDEEMSELDIHLQRRLCKLTVNQKKSLLLFLNEFSSD